jgi:hypothetical protein
VGKFRELLEVALALEGDHLFVGTSLAKVGAFTRVGEVLHHLRQPDDTWLLEEGIVAPRLVANLGFGGRLVFSTGRLAATGTVGDSGVVFTD